MSSKKNHKILIVEDDADVLEIMTTIIQKMGFTTLNAADGEEALRVFKSEKVDLVFSDIKMPNITGTELSVMIKEIDPSVPVILFSGHNKNLLEDKIEGKIVCDHLIYKPFVQQDIFDSLNIFFP